MALWRRKKSVPPTGELVVLPGASGLTLFGNDRDVDEFVSGLVDKLGSPRVVRRAVVNAALVGSTATAWASMSGKFVKLSPSSRKAVATMMPTRSGSPGYFSGALRASNGTIRSFIEWAPVDLGPQQAVAMQQAAMVLALQSAIHEVTEAVERVEGKVDVLNDLVRSQRVGNAIGDYRFLSTLAASVGSGSPLTATDWSTIEHLGAEITRDIETLRAYVRMRLVDGKERTSARARAERLVALSESHLDEILGAILLCEHNLMTWQRLKIARQMQTEAGQVEPALVAAGKVIELMQREDQQLVTALEREIDELTERRGLEGLAPIRRGEIEREAAALNKTIDWFAEQRTLDTTETTVLLPGFRESFEELMGNIADSSRSALRVVVDRVKGTPVIDVSEIEERASSDRPDGRAGEDDRSL